MPEIDGLAGKIHKNILAVFESMRDRYDRLSEAEQREVISRAATIARECVSTASDAIQAAGLNKRCSIVVHGVKINKETIEAKISTSRDDESAPYLIEGAYTPAVISMTADLDSMMDLGDVPKPDPDQPAMFTEDPLDDGQPLDDSGMFEPMAIESEVVPIKHRDVVAKNPPKRKRGRPKGSKNKVTRLRKTGAA